MFLLCMVFCCRFCFLVIDCQALKTEARLQPFRSQANFHPLWAVNSLCLCLCPMADEHRYVLSIISLHYFSSNDKDQKPFAIRLSTSFMMMTASLLDKNVNVWCWHDQSNQSDCRYNVVWHHFICGQWPWAFLGGHFWCNSMAAPKGLEFSSSTLRLGSDVLSPWMTKPWANHSAKLSIFCWLAPPPQKALM